MEHLVLEDEVPDDLEELIAHLTDEVGASTEIEARLARRLAIAFWKGERAERIEVALFDAAPRIRPPHGGFQWEEADPLTTFDVKRFNAIRGYHAQQGREISRCLKELRLLRREALARTDEPGEALENEPKTPPPPANDDAHPAVANCEPTPENEPKPDPWDALPMPVRAELERLLAVGDWPGLAALGATVQSPRYDLRIAEATAAIVFAINTATGSIYQGLWFPVIVTALSALVTFFFLPETKDRDIHA